MSLAIEGEEHVTNIKVETLRKANDAVKAEGQGLNRLLDDATEFAKTVNNDPERGRAINVYQ